jgi:hypothetical protein
MKPIAKLFAFSVIGALTCVAAYGIEIKDLSMEPFQTCKKPPKAPPYKLMHKEYPEFSTTTNIPFYENTDINGDGWCDWISTAASPPHRDNYLLDEPPLEDFIFIGTKTGWRKFGNPKKIQAFLSSVPLGGKGPYGPKSDVAAFINPIFIYSKQSATPYVAAVSLSQDTLEPESSDVVVYQWDNALDTLLEVSQQDRDTTLTFLRQKFCTTDIEAHKNTFAMDAICRRQMHSQK